MGRSIDFYVIPKNIPHDTSKKLCFLWEFQDDEVEMETDICLKLMPNVIPDKATRCKMLLENVYGYDIDTSHWCPKCLMFAKDLHLSTVLLASECCSHSYSNPIWNSKWNIKNLWLGSSNTPVVNLFRNECLYREICLDNVLDAFETIDALGEPLRTTDKNACEETLRILKFLQEWTANDDVHVILKDEA
jgi:hypothetical protein